MNKTILLLLILIPTFLFGQKLIKIKDKENNEIYYVLKSDKSIKHGLYKKFSYNNKLIIKGYYKQGVKDSIWECYNLEGELNLKYNYTNNELLFYKPIKNVKKRKYKIINNENSTDTTLSREPIYLGGDELVASILIKNLEYPASARDNDISGRVYIYFTVDKFGKTSNFHVKKRIGYGLDEEAIRVMKLIPDNWLPGLSNEHPVDVEVIYPIYFEIE